jgi:type II secretory pathway pseudopilin PulG
MKRGFLVFELLMVLLLLGLVVSTVAVPYLLRMRAEAYRDICQEHRRAIEHAEEAYFARAGVHTKNTYDLVKSGHLAVLPACPEGGVYAWVPASAPGSLQTRIGCSLHGFMDPTVGVIDTQ